MELKIYRRQTLNYFCVLCQNYSCRRWCIVYGESHVKSFHLHLDCYQALCDEVLQNYESLPSPEELLAIGDLLDCGNGLRTEGNMATRELGIFRSKTTIALLTERMRYISKTKPLRSIEFLPRELATYIKFLVGPSPYTSVAMTLGFVPSLIDILRFNNGYCGKTELLCDQAIYVVRELIGDVLYITHCSNVAPFGSSESLSIQSGTTDLIFLRDCIGIRSLYVGGQQVPRPAPKGCFFKSFKIGHDRPPPILLIQKQIIVVDITDPGNLASPWWEVYPPPPIAMENCYGKTTPIKFRSDQCLRYIPIKNGIKGVLAICENGRLFFIHFHLSDGKFYPDLGDRSDGVGMTWLYSPLHEPIWNIWVRLNSGFGLEDPSLIIETVAGKFLTFGPYIEPNAQHRYRMHSLRGSAKGTIQGLIMDIQGLGANHHDFKVGLKLSSEEPPYYDRPQISRTPPFQSTSYGKPLLRCAENYSWYFSGVDMNGIVSGRIFSIMKGGRRLLLGMSLDYESSTVFLGQWLPGPDITSDTVAYPRLLTFDEDESPKNYRMWDPWLSADDSTDVPTNRSSIRLEGMVDFWSSHLGTRIYVAPHTTQST